ncbi:MAG: hypothetical protein GY696_37795 [Gammaproteobacteria bacterium]|nr:hypothetical protein [Gammaproteobacteria bacterium]
MASTPDHGFESPFGLTDLDWRSVDNRFSLAIFSAKVCPPGRHYEPCADVIPPSCDNPEPVQPDYCEEDCVCDGEDMVEDKDGSCIPLAECGCFDEEKVYRSVSRTSIL